MPLRQGYVSNRGVTVHGRNLNMSAIHHHGLQFDPWNDSAPGQADAAATNNLMTTTAGPNATTITWTPSGGPNVGAYTGIMNGVAVFLPDKELGSRNVVITVTHATAVVALSGVITGRDVYNNVMYEGWAVTAGGTTKTFTGLRAFKTIVSITITAATNASADSVTIGDGNVFGIPVVVSSPVIVSELMDSATTTAGTVVVSSGYGTRDQTAGHGDPRGTYTPNTAPNGTHTYDVWIISDHPEWSDRGLAQ